MKKYKTPRNPVVAIRVHPNIYNDVMRAASAKQITMSKECEQRLGASVSLAEYAPSSCPCECCYPSSYEPWFI